MKKHNIFKVVLLTLLVIAVCTWIFPSAQFSSELVIGDRAQIGLFDLFSYPMIALYYFMNIFVFMLVSGAFYGVAYRIPAYHKLLDFIAKGFEGRENIFLILMIIFMSAIVSITGLSFPIVFIFPFVISIVLLLGYNKLVAATVTVGSTIAGIAGTTLGTTTVTYLNQILGTNTFDEMLSKVIILVIFMVLLISNVLLYAKKTKNSVEVKNEKEEKPVAEKVSKEEKKEVSVSKKDEKATKKKVDNKTTKTAKTNAEKTKKTTSASNSKKNNRSKTRASMAKNDTEELKVQVASEKKKKVHIWPFALIFDLVVIIMAMSMFDWEGVFEITWFTEATAAVTGFEIAGFAIFSKIFGTIGAFGEWSLNVEIPALILIATCILGLVYRVKFRDFIDGAVDGMKRTVGLGGLMVLIYTVLIIVTYHPFQLLITKFLLDLSNGINVVTMTIAAMFASLFNVDLTYTAQSTLPYVMTVITDTELYPLIGVIFQSVYGLMMLIAPTSIVLLGTLAYLEIPYMQWLKHIWKLFVQLLLVLVIIFLIILAV